MSTYYQRNREKLLNRAKKYCEKKQKISIENCLMKKKMKKENMEEMDVKICLKKVNKD